MVIDLPSDKGLAHFHRITSLLDLPGFVKEADFQQQVEVDDLDRSCFADPLDKKFPIHTKTAAYLNYAYFLDQAKKGNLDDQAVLRCNNGFVKAAKYWNLVGEFQQIDQAMNQKQEKVAAAPSPADIIRAGDYLARDRELYTYEDRNTLAKEIMKSAADVGLPLTVIPEAVHRMAGFGITTKKAALLELTKRYDAERSPTLAEPLLTCIEAFYGLKSDLLGGEVCEKIAGLIDKYDRSRNQVTFPEDVLFAFTKHAADKIASNIVTMIDGTSYKIQDLEKAADAFGVLGKDIVKALQNMDGTLNQVKIAELVDSLPRVDADMLKEALDTLGVKPIQMDKYAMVAETVARIQDTGFTVLRPKLEKRADILSKLEAEDPLVKRALNTLRLLKEGARKKKQEKPPRGLGGMFMKKAPNVSGSISKGIKGTTGSKMPKTKVLSPSTGKTSVTGTISKKTF